MNKKSIDEQIKDLRKAHEACKDIFEGLTSATKFSEAADTIEYLLGELDKSATVF